MKEKSSLFIRIAKGLTFVVCILFFACANEEFITNDLSAKGVTFGDNEKLTVEAARTWFAENSQSVKGINPSDNTVKFSVWPSWNNAKEWKKGKIEVVEAPLSTRNSIVFYDQKTSKNTDWKKDYKKIRNVGRMVFLKDLETGKTRNFVMIIVGSYEYLMKKNNKLSKNIYLYREPEFDGDIFFYTPDGSFINGWKYKKGKITHTISPVKNQSSLPFSSRVTE